MDAGTVREGRLFDMFTWMEYGFANPGVLVPVDGQFARCDECGMVCLVTEETDHKCPEIKADA